LILALSFESEINAIIPPYMYGVELCKTMEAWFVEHPQAKEEAISTLRTLLLKMKQYNASDLDMGAPGCGQHLWMRTYGIKKPVPELGEFSLTAFTSLILCWLHANQKQILYDCKSIDFSVSIQDEVAMQRFRGTVYFDRFYPAANFRRVNPTIFPLDSLGMPPPILERMDLRYEKKGLIILTGITGSGKSTTLDSIIDMNNKNNQAHIVIISNPIEYVHPSIQSIVRHREVGVDTQSFQHGAIEALRQDPDIIMVGEMRDPPTISTVLEITDSGHKTFSTLHTSSAIDSVHRIVAEFPPEEQERIRNRLADVLSVIVSQKLVPTVDNKLVLAKEILSVDSSVQAAIRNKNIGEIYQMMIEGRKTGMFTMEQDLRRLYKSGIISNRTAMNYANNKNRMMQLLSMPG
jgi:twitching motility protein PilT